MLAFDNFAETANRFAERNIFALKTGELLRNRKRLREETLNLACARNGQFVFIGSSSMPIIAMMSISSL